jgi:hypothetical protein
VLHDPTMLDMTPRPRHDDLGVAYASPPSTAPGAVFYGGKGTSCLRLLSWSVRLGCDRWGIPSATWKAG